VKVAKADVNAALCVTAALDRFGVQYRNRNQHEIRIAMCPVCGHQKRRGAESVVVNIESGAWIHHGGTPKCRGDKLALIAAFAGLDISREFPRVLELGAEIAGISDGTDPGELARMRATHDAAREARDRRAAEERAQGEAMVPALWGSLPTRHPWGERYLAGRGLDPAELRQLGDVVRYYRDGSPAVRLHDFETGAPINIVRRRLFGDPKILALDLADLLGTEHIVGTCSTIGTLAGRIHDLDIAGEGPDVAILPEGVADSLAALLAFPGCVVVGASGADRLKHIAAAIAPRLVEARGWLLIVPHVDGGKGETCAADAVRVASRAGLRLDESIHLVDVRPSKDLADAWRAGWRWSWQ